MASGDGQEMMVAGGEGLKRKGWGSGPSNVANHSADRTKDGKYIIYIEVEIHFES